MKIIDTMTVGAIIWVAFIASPISAVAVDIPSDISSTVFEEAATELTLFSVMKGYPDGSFKPDANLTRAEFAAVTIRAMNLDDAAVSMSGQSGFEDVLHDHWALGYINLAQSIGIISGYGDGYFGPDDHVTGDQAVKMLVNALGYEAAAEEHGGYPYGHHRMANHLGLPVNFSLQQPITRGNTALLVHDALDVELLEPVYGSGGEFKISPGRTFKARICNALEIEKREGIVTFDGVSGLHTDSEVDENRISIDDVGYIKGEINALGILGYSVKYYVYKNSGELYAVVKKSINQSLAIDAYDINETSARTISYYSKNNQSNVRKASLIQNIPTIYNGRYFADATSSDWAVPIGNITLLDNNRDGEYDVIFVNEHVNYMVSNVTDDKINLKLFSEKGESRFLGNTNIDLTSKDMTVRLARKEGELVEATDLTADQIISVFSSKDSKLVTVVPAFETVIGMIEEISVDGKVVIDNIEYKLAKNSADEYIACVEVGDSGTFWLDTSGYVTAMSVTRPGLDVITTDNEMISGYLLASDVSSVLDREVKIKVLSNLKDGTRREDFFTLANNVRVDGTVTDPIKAIEDLESAGINRPIFYRLNRSGAVTHIVNFAQVAQPTIRLYNETNNSFDNLYSIDENSLIYFVDINDEGMVHKDIETKLTNNTRYAVKIFDPLDSVMGEVDFSLRKRVFVISVDLKYVQTTSSNGPLLVGSILQFINADGEQGYRIEGLVGNETRNLTLCLEQNKNMGKIKRGVLMTYTLNGFGEISTFKIIAELPSTSRYRLGVGGPYERLYGTAQSLRSNSDYSSVILSLTYDKANGTTDEVAYDIANSPIYMYIPSSGKIQVATVGDIVTDEATATSSVLVYATNFEAKAVVVIR